VYLIILALLLAVLGQDIRAQQTGTSRSEIVRFFNQAQTINSLVEATSRYCKDGMGQIPRAEATCFDLRAQITKVVGVTEAPKESANLAGWINNLQERSCPLGSGRITRYDRSELHVVSIPVTFKPGEKCLFFEKQNKWLIYLPEGAIIVSAPRGESAQTLATNGESLLPQGARQDRPHPMWRKPHTREELFRALRSCSKLPKHTYVVSCEKLYEQWRVADPAGAPEKNDPQVWITYIATLEPRQCHGRMTLARYWPSTGKITYDFERNRYENEVCLFNNATNSWVFSMECGNAITEPRLPPPEVSTPSSDTLVARVVGDSIVVNLRGTRQVIAKDSTIEVPEGVGSIRFVPQRRQEIAAIQTDTINMSVTREVLTVESPSDSAIVREIGGLSKKESDTLWVPVEKPGFLRIVISDMKCKGNWPLVAGAFVAGGLAGYLIHGDGGETRSCGPVNPPNLIGRDGPPLSGLKGGLKFPLPRISP
jgi:hypothetical protein